MGVLTGESVRTFRIILGLCIDLILFGALVPWAAIRAGRMLDTAFPISLNLNAPLFDILGIVSMVLGAAWLFWAWYLLVRRGRGYMTELFGIEISPVTEHLVTGGPFSVHRHPVCVGYLLILAGIGLVSGSLGLTALGVPLLLALVYLYLRLFEEPALRRRFGHDYEAYSERVPMFFPFKRDGFPSPPGTSVRTAFASPSTSSVWPSPFCSSVFNYPSSREPVRRSRRTSTTRARISGPCKREWMTSLQPPPCRGKALTPWKG